MGELSAAPLPGPELKGIHACRPLLYRIAAPTRLTQAAPVPFAAAEGIATGMVLEIAGGHVFSIAPGEWFVRLAPATALPQWHDAMLVSSCCDSLVEWRISSDWLDAICRTYASHAPRSLAPGQAMALGIAGERMMAVRPGSGEALLYHEAALLDWFADLLRRM